MAVRQFLAARHPEFRREVVRTIVVFTDPRCELHVQQPEVAVVRGADLLARVVELGLTRKMDRGLAHIAAHGLAGDRPARFSAGSAISTKRHSALISRICSIVRARDSSRRGLATTKARHIARETATLRRLREKRNSRLRGTSSALDVAIE